MIVLVSYSDKTDVVIFSGKKSKVKKEKLRTHSNEFEDSYDNVAFMGARSMAQYPAIGRKLSSIS